MKLTSSCTSGGCGAKIGPGELGEALQGLPAFHDPRLLVGFDGSDDAAVFELENGQLLISTVDFFPPMVDDPLCFGRIAAANALSDIYAMGGEPLYALNLLCFPQQGDKAAMKSILQGGAEKVLEAGAVIAGGHSIYDHEPKYGLSVTGVVEPARLLRNNTPEPGHKLILTKPLGTGIILASHRAGMAHAEAYEGALHVMQRLNQDAARALRGFAVSACTDVTGFGLLVHAAEMAGEQATLFLDPDALPIQSHALAYAADYLTTAAGQRNRNHLAGRVDVSSLSAPMQEILFDPQTSGGLLVAAAPEEAEALLSEIRKTDPGAALIGEVLPRGRYPIAFGGMNL